MNFKLENLISGPYAVIKVPVNSVTGKCEFKEFVENLPESEKMKILKLLQYFSEYGISNIEKFKKLICKKAPVYEFKAGHQVRVFCFRAKNKDSRVFILLNSFLKKTNKTPKTEIDKAVNLYKLFKDLE